MDVVTTSSILRGIEIVGVDLRYERHVMVTGYRYEVTLLVVDGTSGRVTFICDICELTYSVHPCKAGVD